MSVHFSKEVIEVTRPRSRKPDWDRRILLMVKNLREFSFTKQGVDIGYFERRRYKNAIVLHFLIRAGAIEPLGRISNIDNESLREELSKIYKGTKFFYQIDPKRLDDICTWAASKAPEMVARTDPLDEKKHLLVPRDRAFQNDAYFPWYVGW